MTATISAIDGGHGVPAEPDWASIFADELALSEARAHWREVVSEMREATTLTVANGHAIQRLVLYRIEFDKSARIVAEEGKVKRAKRTAVPQINPQWTTMRQASDAIAVLEAELGLSPRRRSSAAKVMRAKKKVLASDSYLSATK